MVRALAGSAVMIFLLISLAGTAYADSPSIFHVDHAVLVDPSETKLSVIVTYDHDRLLEEAAASGVLNASVRYVTGSGAAISGSVAGNLDPAKRQIVLGDVEVTLRAGQAIVTPIVELRLGQQLVRTLRFPMYLEREPSGVAIVPRGRYAQRVAAARPTPATASTANLEPGDVPGHARRPTGVTGPCGSSAPCVSIRGGH